MTTLKITQTNDSYKISTPDGGLAFFKDDISESKRMLEYIIYTLGLDTDNDKIEIYSKPS